MCITSSQEAGLAWWIFQCHSFFALAPILVGMAGFCTGRRILNPFTILVLILAVIADFLCSSLPRMFVVEIVTYNFGSGPLLTLRGGMIGGGIHVLSMCFCIYFFLKPVKWNVFFDKKFFISIFMLWWLALFSNFLPLYGQELPPLHPVADSVLSVILSVYLNRYSEAKFGILRIGANILISIAIGVLFGMLLWSLLAAISFREIYVTAASSLIACSFLSFLLFHQYKSNQVFSIPKLNLEKYGLSKQEIRICELIEEGHSRSFIQLVLNVSNGTLRNHFKNIYSKVLPESKSSSKDQLQRLTVFLSKKKSKTD